MKLKIVVIFWVIAFVILLFIGLILSVDAVSREGEASRARASEVDSLRLELKKCESKYQELLKIHKEHIKNCSYISKDQIQIWEGRYIKLKSNLP